MSSVLIGVGMLPTLSQTHEENTISESYASFAFTEKLFIAVDAGQIPKKILEFLESEKTPNKLMELGIDFYPGGIESKKKLYLWDETVFLENLDGAYQLVLTPDFDGVLQVSGGQFRIFSPGQSGYSYPDAVSLGVPDWRKAIQSQVGYQSGEAKGAMTTFVFAETTIPFCQVQTFSESSDWRVKFFSRAGDLMKVVMRTKIRDGEWISLEVGYIGDHVGHVFIRQVSQEMDEFGESKLHGYLIDAASRYSSGVYVCDTRIAGNIFYWIKEWEELKCLVSDHF